MKLLILILILLCPAMPKVAYADNSTPHVVIDGDVWLYDEKGEKIFLLPSSYYARINNLDEVYYYVTFNGVAGKVKKNEVQAIGYEFTATGTQTDLNVSSEYSDFSGVQMKKYPDSQAESTLVIPTNSTFTFLGLYPTESGESWYYVKYENTRGYVRAQWVTEVSIAPFTPEVSITAPPQTQDETKGQIELTKEVKIIVVVSLVAVGMGTVALLFFKRSSR